MSTPIILDSMIRVPKELYTEREWRRIKKAVTLKTPTVQDYAGFEGGREVECWREEDGRILLPRNWGRARELLRMYEFEDQRITGEPIGLTFNGTFRTGQENFFSRITSELRADGLGVIGQAGCGFGKTVLAQAIIAELDVPTLVLVHKEFLMGQWADAARDFLDTQVGFVQGDKCEFEDKKIVIAMVQSLARRRYPEPFYKHFGLVMTDETHHVSAPTWVGAITEFPSKWRIGLTATPRRGDRLEDVFFWNIGDVRARGVGKFLDCSVYRVLWNPGIAPQSYMIRGSCSLPRLINCICRDSARTAMLCRMIAKAARAGRKILVLTDRVKHRDDMKERLELMLKDEAEISTSVYGTGKTKKAVAARELAAKADIIISTWPMAKEGLDLPELDTLIMASPKSDVEQAVGRIRRTGVEKKAPMVVDVVDDVRHLYGLSRKRLEFYNRRDDTKNNWDVNTVS